MPTRPPNPNPLLNANKCSRLFQGWVSPLVSKCRKQGTLDISDLYEPTPDCESATMTHKLETQWFAEMKRNPNNPSLIRATIRTMRWEPFLIGLILVPNEIFNILQPILLTFLMKFFEPCSAMPAWHAWFLVSAIILTSFFSSILFNYEVYLIDTFALKMRLAYSGLVFRKVLRLSSHAFNIISSGEITNLLSNDATKIEMALFFINYLWLSPLQVLVMILLFWYYVKQVALIAIGYTFLLMLVQSIFSRFLLHFRNNILLVTDQRVKIMSEIIKSMRIVKMYCWEMAFNKKVRHVRRREITQYMYTLMFDSIQMLFSHTYVNVTFLMMYGAMWWFNIRFDTRFFAIASCLLGHLRLTVVEFFSAAVKDFVHYIAAQRRIQAFLLLDESERDNRLLSRSHSELANKETNEPSMPKTIQTQSPKVVCNLERALWEKNGSFFLKNIVFDAQPGDLICIIGPVGAGKSSLLQTLTGEIGIFDGKVRMHGSFCYVPQESWIFSSTIKTNILFGKPYDRTLFRDVVKATALDTDFAQLPDKENTLVGDQGVMLSGGQKARVNMARALYRNADIYLLDDPLSAVDVKVAKHLFKRSIKSYLADKICILVTHQIQFLQDATKIIVLNNGEMVQYGTFTDLLTSSSSFARLLDDIHQFEQQNSIELHQQLSIISSTDSDIDGEILALSKNVEIKQKGKVKWHVYAAYLKAGFGIIVGLFVIFILSSLREALSMFSSWWLARWSDEESYRYQDLNNCTSLATNNNHTEWSMTNKEWNNHRNQRFYVYCVIVLILVIFTLLRGILSEFMFLNAGRVLHNKMFRRLIRCPIAFFDINPVGRILNRFTKDVATMDDDLPIDVYDFLNCCFLVLSTVALVGVLNPWSFIPALIALFGLLFVRHRFAPFSRDLRRLESISRSPVYSYLTSTIHGLKVIRSYHAEEMCSTEFFSYLDENTRVNHLIYAASRWAALRFDWISLLFIGLVSILSMILRITGYRYFSTADIAMTLSYSLGLMGLLQWTIRLSVELETRMTSVERVLEYCSLEQEPPAQVPPNRRPPSSWPSQGSIIFDNICMSHSSDNQSSLALRHVSMTIQTGEKVGIVGRTGAGKSSLIQTLFRMGTLVGGQIVIDNIDIASIGLDDLRRRISIIPQDPILFTGTMRSNLDPFNDYSDAEIWCALEQVQLKTLVADGMPNGLHSMVSEGGSNLSVGQKQLVCLARAILKMSKILVIDEATANVDNATDELIQRAIREKFKHCTVLTVAHRLRTVIDSDRILVLGNGSVLEFDTPSDLLSNSTSHFTSLVEQAGDAEAAYLRTLANKKSTKDKHDFEEEEETIQDTKETDRLLT
ncbi:unnamed protein product [Rotaria magnacalcarata]|uniref:Uncharacterized protein n=1 Tax=Rotaria magnacalcarata TaxID=392030 RepID=A0A816U3W9_9BILA|nr:unnamed protein product [Rotaria magnacalcarata]CAF4093315.1 unnamed protein product [Rotaria magnacalcarata]